MALAILILAAGQGKRFKSNRPKILHELAGQPLVSYPLAMSRTLRAAKTVVVVSADSQRAVNALIAATDIKAVTAVQRTPDGTAGAVRAAARQLQGFRGSVLILYGDVPLLRTETLHRVVRDAATRRAVGSVLTVELSDPTGYGRVVRGRDDCIRAITEERDADAATRTIREINTGVMCCDAQWLFAALKQLRANNAQREYYLTDIAAIAAAQGNGLVPILTGDPTECRGVNSRAELAAAEAELRQRLVRQWMDAGVTFRDPASVYLDATVRLGQDTIVEPHVTICGKTVIGPACHIKSYSMIEDAQIGAAVEIGPFARLRPGTRLDRNVRVGNFVEIKKSWLKAGAKANHLTYLGDATIGEATNVGCGTITCNYDGVHKHKTIIGDHVFIGSDTQFVAPVRVGRGATIAAGSVITDNVPPGALAIARSQQVLKRTWKRKRK